MHKDCRIWSGTNNGTLSIISSYELHTYSDLVNHSRKWSRIWKIVVPERVRYHVWMMFVQGLKTNLLLFQRNSPDPFCDLCINTEESALHVMCDSQAALKVWLVLVPHNHRSTFFSTSLEEWLDFNLTSKIGCRNRDWTTLWATTCFKLWQWRNQSVHNPDFPFPLSLGDDILYSHECYCRVMLLQKKVFSSNQLRIIKKWSPAVDD